MNRSDQRPLIAAIVGPTASGKTALAVKVARLCGGEIVCLDSMQIYAEMAIGTALPDDGERGGVPHHLFGSVDPGVTFSSSDYNAAAEGVIADIAGRGKLPIFVGGTGLYLDSLVLGCGDSSAAPDGAYREELREFASQNGADALHAMLRAKDPAAAEAIHPNNVKRVIRALEICRACGTKSEYDRRSRGEARYDLRAVRLDFEDRGILYGRIDRRVDDMLDRGLVDEARHLLEIGALAPGTTASQAIGYKELLPYIRGEESLQEAAERLKRATRRYAKRQITWFSQREEFVSVKADRLGEPEKLDRVAASVAEFFTGGKAS